MLQIRSRLDVADNTGARMAKMIGVIGKGDARDAGIGDVVRITETRPISKLKRWRLVEILKH